MTDAKAREFWIDPEPDGDDSEIQTYQALNKHPGQGPFVWQANLIHVIEYSALEALQKENTELRAELQCYRKISCNSGGRLLYEANHDRDVWQKAFDKSEAERGAALAMLKEVCEEVKTFIGTPVDPQDYERGIQRSEIGLRTALTKAQEWLGKWG